MFYLVIGNIIALIGSLLMIGTGLLKKKSKILLVQTIQIVCFIMSNLVLRGYTGAIVNGVSCIRNLLAYKDKLNKIYKIIIILVTLTLCLSLNNKGIIGLLPLISSIIYTAFITIKDDFKFKLLIAFTMLLWGIYDYYIMSYTSSIFDFITMFASLITIIRIKKE